MKKETEQNKNNADVVLQTSCIVLNRITVDNLLSLVGSIIDSSLWWSFPLK